MVQDLEKYLDVVTPSNNITERSFNLGYVDHLTISNGFHLVHDPELGQEVMLKGPDNVLELIENHLITKDYFNLSFNQAVRLEAPVTVRLNLNAHHVGTLRLSFSYSEKENNWTNFTTLGPLVGHQMELMGQLRSDRDVLVDVNQLNYAPKNCASCKDNEINRLSGRADQVSLSSATVATEFSELTVKTFQLTFMAMSGRKLSFGAVDKLTAIYDTKNGFDASANYPLLAPDTFLVSPQTEVSIQYRSGELLVDWDKGVIIRK